MSWIKWLQSQCLYTVTPSDSVQAAVQKMTEHGVGALVVVDGEELFGILSERDVVRRVVAEGLDAESTPVGDVCTTDAKTVGESASISECAALIKRHGFRHVPIVDDRGRPIAMLSTRDFLRYAVDELEEQLARAYSEQRLEELVDPYSLVG